MIDQGIGAIPLQTSDRPRGTLQRRGLRVFDGSLDRQVRLKDHMAELTQADKIWNRACGEDPMRSLPGDRALASLLRAHGLVMNGGVLHAVECLTANELSDSQFGYRFYGLDGVASLLSRARRIFEAGDDLGDHEQRLDALYAEMIPSDSSLVERFEKRWQSNPSDYAPLRDEDTERV